MRFRLDGVHLTIMQGERHPATNAVVPRFPVIAFAVPDLAWAIDALTQAGVPLPCGIEHGSGARWGMFHDPGGNLVELAEFTKD